MTYLDGPSANIAQQQAFEGLKNAGRKVRRPDCTLATTDHVRIYPSHESLIDLLAESKSNLQI